MSSRLRRLGKRRGRRFAQRRSPGLPEVEIDRKFKKRLREKTAKQQAAVLECVERIVDNPSRPGLNTHPVQSAPGVFSSRVDRSKRVTWERNGKVIVMRNHCTHEAVYRRP